MPSLLRTKIQLPPQRAGVIPRERLIQCLAHGLDADSRLTLVSAPAGFGKSSCLVSWAHRLHQDGFCVAWYALDERDNDPAHFATYLREAIRQCAAYADLPGAGVALSLDDTIHAVINAAHDSETPTVLILDDYHLIGDARIHEALSLMLEHLPVNLKLVIGTRADPPVQLARLRSHRAVCEVRLAELRFNPDEMSLWLRSALGWQPSQALLQRLDSLTEGWAAALALIMMSHPLVDERALEGQLTRYSRSQQQIFEYFAQEVFQQQPAPLREFLLDTCILRWLQPELCHALTGRADSLGLLRQLAANSLFITPLSSTEPLYRYHHLFEQYLQELLLSDPERFRRRHRQAAEWHLAHQHIVEAVSHALEAGDLHYAAQIIEESAWEPLTSRGEISTLMRWLPQFDDSVLRQRPRLCLYFSRALYLTGEITRSQAYVELAADALEQMPAGTPDRVRLQPIAFNYLATLAGYRGDLDAGRRWIAAARDRQDSVEALDRVRIANTDAHLCFLAGELDSARRAYEHALTLASELDHHYLMLDAHHYLAQIDLLAGDLGAVEARCTDQLQRYEPTFGPLSAILLPLGAARYGQNRLREAESLLRQAMTLARRAAIPEILWGACLALIDVLLARGDADEAAACVSQARLHSRGFHSPLMDSLIGAAQARVWLAQGEREEAVAWADTVISEADSATLPDVTRLTAVRIWLTVGATARARQALPPIIDQALAHGRHAAALSGRLLLARALLADGHAERALNPLRDALTAAQVHGYVRPFADDDPAQRLLNLAVDHQIVPEYTALLLDALRAQPVVHPSDQLTEREIDVLRRIAEGASNQQIADDLIISVGTVKSHIHHLMTKLDAANRTEAVRKARSLRLLSD